MSGDITSSNERFTESKAMGTCRLAKSTKEQLNTMAAEYVHVVEFKMIHDMGAPV